MIKTFLPIAGFTLSLIALPALAQQPPPPPPGPPPHGDTASIKLDFGAGRRVDIRCGKLSLEDCIRVATPLIDKVAATEPSHRPSGNRGNK